MGLWGAITKNHSVSGTISQWTYLRMVRLRFILGVLFIDYLYYGADGMEVSTGLTIYLQIIEYG